jgi:hypothetical protein
MPVQPAPERREPDEAFKAGRAMGQSLKRLLDRVPGSREVLPHLAALERALRAEGTQIIATASLPVLARMGAQLASLPVNPSDLPLRALQVQLLTAIDRRGHPPPPRYLSSFMGASKLEVSEVSHSAYAAALQQDTVADPPDFQPR